MQAATNDGVSSQSSGGDIAPGQGSGKPLTRLPSGLDLTGAQFLRDTLVAQLTDGSLLLDASAVERMSTPCVQVLLAAARAADLAGSPFQVRDASEVFQAALADLGLKAEFNKWMV